MYHCVLLADNAEKLAFLTSNFSTIKETVVSVFASDTEEDPEELCFLYQPDIVVLDIDKEYEDVVRMINVFETILSDVRIIVFTNYMQFSFDSSIPHLEHVYFLPRPVSAQALGDCTGHIVGELDVIRERNFSPTALNNLLNDYIPVIRQHYLSMLLRQPVPETENVLQKFETLKINCPGPFYTVIVADILRTERIENFEAINFLLRTNIKSAIEAKGYQCYIFFDSEFKINCLVGAIQSRTEEILEDILNDVKIHFDKMVPLKFVAGIGDTVNSATEINQSFKAAEIAALHAGETENIVSFKNIKASRKDELIAGYKIEQILTYYAEGKMQKFEESIAKQMRNFEKVGDVDVAKRFVIKYIVKAMAKFGTWGIEMLDYQSIPFLLSRTYSAVDIRSILACEREFSRFMVTAQQGAKSQESYLVEQAVRFISNNLSNPSLDLEMVSSNIGISKSYLCRIFHRITERNFSGYVREQRIEYAKKLLTTSNMKTYQVALAAGFTTSKYFSSVFKGVTGMTPSEYQHQTGDR